MSAPQRDVKCVLLRPNGDTTQLEIDHRHFAKVLGAPPTIVGAVRSLNAQAVAARDQASGTLSKQTFPDHFEKNLRGDVLLFRTDDEATPQDLLLAEYSAWVNEGMPDVDDGEEGEDGDSEEEEEGEESEPDDGSESESGIGEDGDDDIGEDDLEELPLDDMKSACEAFQLDSNGTREELTQRLRAHMMAVREEGADDDDDDDDDDEAAAAPSVPGPKKTIAKSSRSTSSRR